MIKYLAPLGIFVGGQLLLLIVLLFMPAIGDAGEGLAENTTDWAAIGWGWTWVVSSTRLIVVVLFELFILFAVAKAFLSARG